ncbi:GspH/FimT family pseudopilin [Acinetobacter sp. B10A]|uniref:GspH/FimT family pseudopilin n=1 Tax=Acinetobacter baretiae TaxID=2605383 RepID=UPI001B3C98BC|nr:GspH/FimT family pseudopilin [Acinetobacter baretiae]MBF7684831.1 GspH/FimT family pseudopilin [Acinetobacter baretiae]
MTREKIAQYNVKLHAFTVLEFIITLAILAIVTTLALPAFAQLQARLESKNIYPYLNTTLQRYKLHAVTQRQNVILCSTNNGQTCNQSNSWNHGILAIHDQNYNHRVDPTDPVLSFHHNSIHHGTLTWKGGATTTKIIVLQGDTGLPRGSMGSFYYCSDKNNQLSHKNALSHMGHLRHEKLNGC